MKKVVVVLLLLSALSIFSNCTKTAEEKTSQRSELLENREWLKNDMFSKMISASSDKDFNMGKLEQLLKTQYNVDLWDEMRKLGLEVPAVVTPAARAAGINVDPAVFFERLNIGEESKLYPYLIELTNSVTEETTPEMLKSTLTSIESRLEMDINIPMKEKESFCAALLLITTNINSIEQALLATTATVGGRTNGWFRTLWRVVRSVVVTTVLGAAIGALKRADGGGIVSLVGAVVGGALAFHSAITAMSNDTCYAAYGCNESPQGGIPSLANSFSTGWRQSCVTGAC